MWLKIIKSLQKLFKKNILRIFFFYSSIIVYSLKRQYKALNVSQTPVTCLVNKKTTNYGSVDKTLAQVVRNYHINLPHHCFYICINPFILKGPVIVYNYNGSNTVEQYCIETVHHSYLRKKNVQFRKLKQCMHKKTKFRDTFQYLKSKLQLH